MTCSKHQWVWLPWGFNTQVKLHALDLAMTHLRDAVSLFSRYTITEDEIDELETHCRNYFILCRDIFTIVTPTSWTIGYVVAETSIDVLGLDSAWVQHKDEKPR